MPKKAERNVDKIKRLEKELAAEQGEEAGGDTGRKEGRPMPAVLFRRGVPEGGRDLQREGEVERWNTFLA